MTKRIYFIQAGEDGPIKIGIATNIEARLSSLQVGSPTPLHLIAHTPGTKDEEEDLHQRLTPYRIRGEWFRPHADVLAEVDAALKHDQLIVAEPGRPPELLAARKRDIEFMRRSFATLIRALYPRPRDAHRALRDLSGAGDRIVSTWMKGKALPGSRLLTMMGRRSQAILGWRLWILAAVGTADVSVSAEEAFARLTPELVLKFWERTAPQAAVGP